VNIAQVAPVAEAVVGVEQPITVRFDRALVSVESLEGQENLPQPIVLSPPAEGLGRWIAADTYAFYPQPGLNRGIEYEVTVNPIVSPGMELPSPYEWHFATEGPRVEASFPFHGASEVESATAIRLLFAQPMDREAVEENFLLSTGGDEVPVAGEFRWEDDETLLFVPQEPLDPATEYEIEVGEEATAQGGVSGLMAPYRAVFTTVDFLAVDSVQPAPGSIEVSIAPTDTAITIQFNHPVVPIVGLSEQQNLPDPLTFTPSLEGEGEWITTEPVPVPANTTPGTQYGVCGIGR
jgi:hypothetical protein